MVIKSLSKESGSITESDYEVKRLTLEDVTEDPMNDCKRFRLALFVNGQLVRHARIDSLADAYRRFDEAKIVEGFKELTPWQQ